MSKRRDQLKELLTPVARGSVDRPERTAATSGAMKSMGLSLQRIGKQAEEADKLRAQLASGAQVIELDPAVLDASFVHDRIDHLQDLDSLRASLAEDGQQVPILVRPLPNGRFQIAYGHRRVAAMRELGLPVRAVVQQLSDEQLIIAQGKENTDRKDLSFIETALFAARLEDRGFTRAAIMTALSLHKSNLSKMIALVRELPEELVIAIGAAPKIGRPRWEDLASLVRSSRADWREAVSQAKFNVADSNTRFGLVVRALTERPKKQAAQIVKAADGALVARIQRGKGRTHITVDERTAPEFAQYMAEQLPEIYAAFTHERSRQ